MTLTLLTYLVTHLRHVDDEELLALLWTARHQPDGAQPPELVPGYTHSTQICSLEHVGLQLGHVGLQPRHVGLQAAGSYCAASVSTFSICR